MKARARGEVCRWTALTCRGHVCLLPVDAILGCARLGHWHRAGLGCFGDKGSLSPTETRVVLAFVMLINSTRGCLTQYTRFHPTFAPPILYWQHFISHGTVISPAAALTFACASSGRGSSWQAQPAMCYGSETPLWLQRWHRVPQLCVQQECRASRSVISGANKKGQYNK